MTFRYILALGRSLAANSLAAGVFGGVILLTSVANAEAPNSSYMQSIQDSLDNTYAQKSWQNGQNSGSTPGSTAGQPYQPSQAGYGRNVTYGNIQTSSSPDQAFYGASNTTGGQSYATPQNTANSSMEESMAGQTMTDFNSPMAEPMMDGSQGNTQNLQAQPSQAIAYDPTALNSVENFNHLNNSANLPYSDIMQRYYALEYWHPFMSSYSNSFTTKAGVTGSDGVTNSSYIPLFDKKLGVAGFYGFRAYDNFRVELGAVYHLFYLKHPIQNNDRIFHIFNPAIRGYYDIMPQAPISAYIGGEFGYGLVNYIVGSNNSLKGNLNLGLLLGLNFRSNENRDFYVGYRFGYSPQQTYGAIGFDEKISITSHSLILGMKLRSSI